MSNPRTVDNSAKRLADLKECATLDKFIPLRARLTGGEIALKQFNRTLNAWDAISYLELNERIIEWRKAFASLGLQRGTRVSILLNNSVDHVLADQATLANAMIPVPLHAIDTPGSQAFILADSGAECLVTNKLESTASTTSSVWASRPFCCPKVPRPTIWPPSCTPRARRAAPRA